MTHLKRGGEEEGTKETCGLFNLHSDQKSFKAKNVQLVSI